jgi:hypothetical protein
LGQSVRKDPDEAGALASEAEEVAVEDGARALSSAFGTLNLR